MSDALGPEGSYYEAKKREEEAGKARRKGVRYPTVIVILYLILGAVFDLWHPGWLLFLTIPLNYLHFNSMKERLVHPISITLLYLVLGIFFDLWHPGWLVFLLIPFFAVNK
ncbi:MAG: hypothetical protein IKK75_16145 [Clostridia bacterium]|nr:hypothetical protein [Clostridia bacterium]